MERIAGLLASGKAYLEGETLVGIAADGTHVTLGDVGYGFQSTVDYLGTHPTPADW